MTAHRRLTGRVVIATHNPGKLAEMRELLAPFGIEAVSAGELGLPEPDETGTMYAENAAIKAHAAAQAAGFPALADDSGVAVEALDGAPGLFSARWAGKPADFLFLSGEDMLTVPLIACGAVGIITVLGNAFPQKFSDMARAALAGDFARAQQLLYQLVPLNPLMYEEGNPVGVKAALALQGVCDAAVRLPLVPASEGLTARIKALL